MNYSDHTKRRLDQAGGDQRVLAIQTLQAMIVAFVLAFVFRAFVVEAFMIPTGSMAPTLRGEHLLVRSPYTGHEFAVGPATTAAGSTYGAVASQGDLSGDGGPRIDDPLLVDRRTAETGDVAFIIDHPRPRMGDRILVLKWLYSLRNPRRFEVLVFRNPTDAAQNLIKRLIGLPGETVWLADGDVFTSIAGSRFAIRRKPESVQRAVWQKVFDATRSPLDSGPRGEWESPWEGDGWTVQGRRFVLDAPDGGTLHWRDELKPIVDEQAYNAIVRSMRTIETFAVSDVRVAASIERRDPATACAIRLECHGHEFEAILRDGRAVVSWRLAGDEDAPWHILDEGSAPLPVGRAVPIEFWHVDQALWLFVNGRRVLYAEYEWDAGQRLAWATGLSGNEAAALDGEGHPYLSARHRPRPPRLQWSFDGPVTLHRLQVDRDLYYQPDLRAGDDRYIPARGTAPGYLAELGPDEFFLAGDNSPASYDARHWGDPEPWIAAAIDPNPGVVHRSLILGKAFFVYFPSPEGLSADGARFIPNFGEMRFIR